MKRSLTCLLLALAMLLSLFPASAWAAEPGGAGTAQAPYEIRTPDQLFRLSEIVAKAGGSPVHARLLGDLDLQDKPFPPMGTGSAPFSGSFDGGGFTVSGLRVQGGDWAGLFGSAKNARIENLVLRGSVSGTRYTGGLLGQAGAGVTLVNCGSEAAVTGTGYWTGGIAGRFYGSGSSVEGCYNRGAVTGPLTGSSVCAGGIAGKDDEGISFTNCYNTGAVRGFSAGGICGNDGGSLASRQYCYQAGTVEGTKTGAIAPGVYARISRCWYLEGSGTDAHEGAASCTSQALSLLTPSLNGTQEPPRWKSVPGSPLPLLLWEKEDTETRKVLGVPRTTGWKTAEDTGLPLGILSWTPAEEAEAYTLILWKDAAALEYPPVQAPLLEAVARIEKVSCTEYDFQELMAAAGPGSYYGTVSPLPPAGSPWEPCPVPQTSPEAWTHISLSPSEEPAYVHAVRLEAPAGLRWEGTAACWQPAAHAAAYEADLLLLGPEGSLSSAGSFRTAGPETSLGLGSHMNAGASYVFRVRALSREYVALGESELNSPLSLLSTHEANAGPAGGICTPGAPAPQEPDRTDWIPISSALEWIQLANTEDVVADEKDPQVTLQDIAWSKQYYLTCDLDFSRLPPALGAKTKSVGTVAHPFRGTLDGCGHTVTGLTLSNLDAGLLGCIGPTGQVYDLTIRDANVLFSDNAAVLAYANHGTIRSCAVLNTNISADTGAVLGGLVSRNFGTVSDSCTEGGTLTSNSPTATGFGGLAGSCEEGGTIVRCWSSMDIRVQSSYAGGFVGLCYGGLIRDCFSLGDVSARDYSGGFAGRSVFSGSRYENCYAAGAVTVTGPGGHGFIGGSKPDSAFQPDLSTELSNCYCSAAAPADAYASPRTEEEMGSPHFLTALGGEEVWARQEGVNGGKPYLRAVRIPQVSSAEAVTVSLALALYDREVYRFRPMGSPLSVTLESTGNTRVTDVMDAAARQGLLTYSYETTPRYGRYIHTINGRAVEKPDGWMFTVNDSLSGLSASLASVKSGDRILWYEGTTENHYQPPLWKELDGVVRVWTDIGSREELLALAHSHGPEAMGKNYRLTADLDLKGLAFPGIGTPEVPFTGFFDGGGHKISGLTLTGEDCVGFFRAVKGGTVQDLHLRELSVTGKSRVGALVGWAQAELNLQDPGAHTAGLLGNCSAEGTVSGCDTAGGLVGLNDGKFDSETLFSVSCAIDRCVSRVRVLGRGPEAAQIGGLVGCNEGTVTRSSALGDVSAPEGSMVGGLAGNSPGALYDSDARGDVEGCRSTGGFAGSSTGEVRRCCSLGTVRGTERVGSFAGHLRCADYVMGAGMVLLTGTGAEGYCGGLAGYLSGTLTGPENQITVREAYGSCVQPSGAPLRAVGNQSAFQSSAQQELLLEMGITSTEILSRKLYEMFGLNLKVPLPLRQEWAKYADFFRAEAPGPVSLLRPGQEAGEGFTLTCQVSHPLLKGGQGLTLLEASTSPAALQVPVTLLLEDGAGNRLMKQAQVLLPPSGEAVEALMDGIAAHYRDTREDWKLLDLSLYGTIPGKTLRPGPAPRAEALDRILETPAGTDLSLWARQELVLRAIGVDSARLYPGDASEPVNHRALPKGEALMKTSHYTVPWLLLAELQGQEPLFSSEEEAALLGILRDALGEGLFGFPGREADPDTAGAVLSALASRYETNPEARALADTVLERLPRYQGPDGSFGSANSDAMVILGLLALGRDPREMKAESGATLPDGLLSYVNPRTGRFQYEGRDNDLATEQGFRALSALWAWGGAGAFQAYDFSHLPCLPGFASGRGLPMPFRDVENHWGREAISYVYSRGIMKGTGPDRFSPEGAATRAMFVTLLYRLEGSPAVTGEAVFRDVDPAEYFGPPAEWAAREGIMGGFGNGTFGPMKPITREQMASVLHRYARLKGRDAGERASLDAYRDKARVSPWAEEALSWAVARELIRGVGDSRLAPASGATRAQMAAIFMRYLEFVAL